MLGKLCAGDPFTVTLVTDNRRSFSKKAGVGLMTGRQTQYDMIDPKENFNPEIKLCS
jgi:hypothetical protein